LLEPEGLELNKHFFTFIEKQRPYITLKWAQTTDGFVARSNYDSKWISNDLSRQLTHKWRSEEDAVLVGTLTANHDNPSLNVRDWSGRNPVRVVIDRFLKLDKNLNLFDGAQRTICYNTIKDEETKNVLFVRLDEKNFVSQLVVDLRSKNLQSVLVEGGAFTLQLFIDAGLWDEARIFESPISFGTGIIAPSITGNLVDRQQIANDALKIYRNQG
jgi:diaminohydroxyphosphoribosylaminopyrimidine deaminase/5-amino-6-(5-phosphoribosylamino)uracil reductase